MKKDFDTWNERKKRIHSSDRCAYAHPREIWWCALGINVGAETDGKHDTFERPVLVLRVYNTQTLLAAPLTGKAKNDPFHFRI